MSYYVTIDGYHCLAPEVLAGECRDLLDHDLVASLDFDGKANGYTCPRGQEPGECWLLVTRETLDQLGVNDAHVVVMRSPNANVTLRELYIDSASNMSPGPDETDANGAYLIHLLDVRAILKMSAFSGQYNLRCMAPPALTGTSLYHSESLNAGALWTWQTMVTSIVSFLPGVATVTAALPYVPDGSPEGWQFFGVSAWCALHQVLAKIRCTTVFNPITGGISIVQLGTTQAGLAAAIAALVTRRVFDFGPVDSTATNIPETVRVYFHRLDKNYGSEPETPRTANWLTNYITSKVALTGIAGAAGGTVAAVWDDLPSIVNFDGTLSNDAALQTRANEIAANYTNMLDVSQRDRMKRIYSGLAATILPGSQITAVKWADTGDGPMLTIARYPDELGPGGIDDCCRPVCQGNAERIAPPDLGRATFPNYPRLPQVVTVYSATPDVTTGLFSGKVTRINPEVNPSTAPAYVVGEDCWLIVLNQTDGTTSPATATLTAGERYVGRLVGSYDVGGDVRPMYTIYRASGGSNQIYRVQLTQTKHYATNGVGKIVSWDGANYTAAGADVGLIDTFGVWPRAEVGWYAWVALMGDRTPVTINGTAYATVYDILWCQGWPRHIHALLYENMGGTTSQQADSTIVTGWGDADNGARVAGFVGMHTTLFDVRNRWPWAKTNDYAYAVYNEILHRYYVEELPGITAYGCLHGAGSHPGTGGAGGGLRMTASSGSPLVNVTFDNPGDAIDLLIGGDYEFILTCDATSDVTVPAAPNDTLLLSSVQIKIHLLFPGGVGLGLPVTSSVAMYIMALAGTKMPIRLVDMVQRADVPAGTKVFGVIIAVGASSYGNYRLSAKLLKQDAVGRAVLPAPLIAGNAQQQIGQLIAPPQGAIIQPTSGPPLF